MIYTNFQRTFCQLKHLFLELYINNNKGVSYYILGTQNWTPYQSIHKVQEYSELLNISSKHLTECVRKNVRKTPLQIINQRLVLQSQRLLLFSRLRIKEIAFNLGFIDTSHFVKFFKKETGESPSEYRERHQFIFMEKNLLKKTIFI